MPSVEKSPINQRFLRFRQKNGCVFLFPQSDDISGALPRGDRLWRTGNIHFGERILFRKSEDVRRRANGKQRNMFCVWS